MTEHTTAEEAYFVFSVENCYLVARIVQGQSTPLQVLHWLVPFTLIYEDSVIDRRLEESICRSRLDLRLSDLIEFLCGVARKDLIYKLRCDALIAT